jgi:hypothetical protein
VPNLHQVEPSSSCPYSLNSHITVPLGLGSEDPSFVGKIVLKLIASLSMHYYIHFAYASTGVRYSFIHFQLNPNGESQKTHKVVHELAKNGGNLTFSGNENSPQKKC